MFWFFFFFSAKTQKLPTAVWLLVKRYIPSCSCCGRGENRGSSTKCSQQHYLWISVSTAPLSWPDSLLRGALMLLLAAVIQPLCRNVAAVGAGPTSSGKHFLHSLSLTACITCGKCITFAFIDLNAPLLLRLLRSQGLLAHILIYSLASLPNTSTDAARTLTFVFVG